MGLDCLVIGATGRIGSLVVRELAGNGRPVGGLVRTPDRAASLLPAGVHPVVGDLGDAASLAAAMRGVRAVLVTSPVHPELAAWQRAAVNAAALAGVRRIVKLSGSAWTMRSGDATTIGAAHAEVEAAMAALAAGERQGGEGPRCVSIRPNAFLQGMLGRILTEVQAGGHVTLALGEASVAFADIRDIASACAHALVAADVPPIFEVTGPAAIGGADIASLVQHLLKRPVSYRSITVAEAIERARAAGQPAFTLAHQQEVLTRLRAGAGSGVSPSFEATLGRAPRHAGVYLAEALARPV